MNKVWKLIRQISWMLFWTSLQSLKTKIKKLKKHVSITSKRDNRFPSPLDNHDTWTVIVMATKKDTDLTLKEYRSKLKLEDEWIVVPQKVAQIDLLSPRNRQKIMFLTRSSGYHQHPFTGAYSCLCSTSLILTSVPDCLPSGIPVIQVKGLKGMTFVDQLTGDIYDNDYDKSHSFL